MGYQQKIELIEKNEDEEYEYENNNAEDIYDKDIDYDRDIYYNEEIDQ